LESKLTINAEDSGQSAFVNVEVRVWMSGMPKIGILNIVSRCRGSRSVEHAIIRPGRSRGGSEQGLPENKFYFYNNF